MVAFTGSGISAESGVPTFREAQTGLWAQFRPEELATPEAFRQDPARVWSWYEWRRELCRKAEPNAGHHALVELERRVPQFCLVTQNVDGLHQRAGSRNVIELHGSILATKCFDDDEPVESWETTSELPPRCPRCGGRLRPNVVWFNEQLPLAAFAEARAESERADVFLCIGTSGLVDPAASLPRLARASGAVLVELNPSATPLSDHATHLLRGTAAQLLPRLNEALGGSK